MYKIFVKQCACTTDEGPSEAQNIPLLWKPELHQSTPQFPSGFFTLYYFALIHTYKS